MQKAAYKAMVGGLSRDVREHTGFGALVVDFEEEQFAGDDAMTPFCRACVCNTAAAGGCRAVYANAAVNSFDSGEPFYYTCWAGLLFVAVALAPMTRIRGCIAVSGFAPAGDEWRPVDGILDRLPSGRRPAEKARWTALIRSVPVITTGEMRGIGAYLLEATFTAGINSAAFFKRRSGIYGQQRAIAECARRYKPADLADARQVLRARVLVAALSRGDPGVVERHGVNYLAGILQACNWDLARLKAHLRVPLALTTRDAILSGADWATTSSAEMRFITRLDQARTVEDACYLFTAIMHEQAQHAAQTEAHERVVSERVTHWLETNYREDVSLAAAARSVGASVPSIVKHLRRDTGKSFHQLLVEIRVAEAKRLLATTALGLSEIAAMCGFCDQSHFTRHLQKAINLAPGQFRRLLKLPPDEVAK